ncbi:MAG: rRNA maturation RNase YbeY [Pseudothermotoga sp.]|uniref:rRNA maturation RNase YbeY n=1 Tax=Pseudothermotoga sp. TaxID=2033661 RepID=UPI002586D577|nr:rRNA maturation RNase YbeY [Pseudothermotoga sp.]MDI6862619.1 rRNA maturation RNase YbeY [Pseudothermotoga sp.]
MRIINRTRRSLPIERIQKILEKIVEKEIGDVAIDLLFVGERTIGKLNEAFRNTVGPTDVLTFVYKDEDLYGEVFLCPTAIAKNARKFGCNFEEELLRVVIHAALHLAGYDHEFDVSQSKIMFQKQEAYLKEVERYDG